jgi:hypothetical protein
MIITIIRKPGKLSRFSDGLRAAQPGFDSRQGQEIFLYSIGPKQVMGTTHFPIQWVLGALSFVVKRLGSEADPLLDLVQMSRMVELYIPSPVRLIN